MAVPRTPRSGETADSVLATGVDHFLNGRMREAAVAFQRALALDPGNEQAQAYLRNMLSPTGADVARSTPPAGQTAWDDGPAVRPVPSKPPVVPQRPPDPKPVAAAPAKPAVLTPKPVNPPATPPPPPPKPAAPAKPSRETQAQQLLKEARKAADLGDFTGAVERCDQVLQLIPDSRDALALREMAAATLVQMYESQLGGKNGVPEVIANPAEIIWLSLDNRAGFVLSQIDGQVTYDDLYAICGMSPLDTSRILSQLVEQKVIRTRLGGSNRR